MSEKLRPISYNGETLYVRMSKSDYKWAKKQLAGEEAESVFTWLKSQNGKQIDGLKEGQKINVNMVSSEDKYDIGQARGRENAGEAGRALARGQETMQSKKDYKENRNYYESVLTDKFEAAGLTPKDAAKAAKKEAKALVNVEKAADEVLASEYFLPGEEEKYKAAKAAAKETGKRPVMLEKSDYKLLQSKEFDEAFEGRVRDEKGNIVKEGTLNSDKLKLIASKMVGDDNTIDNEERVQLTGDIKDYKDRKHISHAEARKTKNLFKHLGFDHEHDFTETKRIATVVGMTLAGAGLGAGVGALVSTTSRVLVAAGQVYQLRGNVVKTPDIFKEVSKNQVVPGTLIGTGIGLGAGLWAASKINDIKDQTYHKKAEEPPVEEPPVTQHVEEPPVEEHCEAEIIEEKTETKVEIPNIPYKMQKGDIISNVVAAKYGITDRDELRAAIREVRKATGIPESGRNPNGSTAIPHIKVDDKTLMDAYFLPETILGGKYSFIPEAKVKPVNYVKRGEKANGSNNTTSVTKVGTQFVVNDCNNNPIAVKPTYEEALKAKNEWDSRH